MRAAALSLLLLTFATGSAARDDVGSVMPVEVLRLDEVLDSVDAHYPLLAAARMQRDVAAGTLQLAEGGFDTQLVAQGQVNAFGFYENQSGGAGIEQNTRS